MRRSTNVTPTDVLPLALAASGPAIATLEPADEPQLSEYRDILLDHKWMLIGVIALALLAGALYVAFATPVYRAGLLVQIEDSPPDTKRPSTEALASDLFDVKTPATGEIQVIGSRMVLGAAVDQTGLRIGAQPHYLPLVGKWLSRRATELSTPGIFGLGGYVSGSERIQVDRFDVPPSLEDSKPFVITAGNGGRYTVRHPLLGAPLEGVVGQLLRVALPDGELAIQLGTLAGEPGAEFSVSVASRLAAIERLQERLQMSEQGRQSNVIGVSLEDSDRPRLAQVLNAIGDAYVRQNMQRRSAEAEKTLAFLESQMPVFERQLRTAEDAYARFRNKNGTVDFDEEAKVWLLKSSELQTSLLDLQQSRRKAQVNFTDQSPQIQLLSGQIGAVQADVDELNARIARMPNLQRDALRLERDVRVNGALYQSMQNNVLQMRLVKEGKVGNVRLLDRAVVSKVPVKPRKLLVLAFALVLGGLIGPALAIAYTRSRPGIHNPAEIEQHTGLEVLAVVSDSAEQSRLDQTRGNRAGPALLADAHPNSGAIEALRGLRVGLKPAIAQASNNRIHVTGATPGIGKSFVACNLATLLAQSGKRVLLINADLRKGDSSVPLHLQREGGLTELLSGELRPEQAIVPGVRPNLDVLTAGKLPAFPTDMLESDAFTGMLETLSARYDLVVIDTAPVLVAADASAVAPACGLVLLVARTEHTQLGELNESIRRLTQAGAQINGVLLNGMNLKRRYIGSHGYRQGSYRYSDYPLASVR